MCDLEKISFVGGSWLFRNGFSLIPLAVLNIWRALQLRLYTPYSQGKENFIDFVF